MIDTFLPHEYVSVSLSIVKYRLEHAEKDISSQISLQSNLDNAYDRPTWLE